MTSSPEPIEQSIGSFCLNDALSEASDIPRPHSSAQPWVCRQLNYMKKLIVSLSIVAMAFGAMAGDSDKSKAACCDTNTKSKTTAKSDCSGKSGCSKGAQAKKIIDFSQKGGQLLISSL
ncbi:MAG: hypothetical protein HY299_17160 [Verrucomicrobia bacterium]|nr:hypothetical protein [Verrucomicrobiota bacterium]